MNHDSFPDLRVPCYQVVRDIYTEGRSVGCAAQVMIEEKQIVKMNAESIKDSHRIARRIRMIAESGSELILEPFDAFRVILYEENRRVLRDSNECQACLT